MSLQQNNHYKDIPPTETINQLKSVLKEMNIELEENWVPKNSVGTFSLRLTIHGTNIGTNGKGVTKDYARASAYAEFFERFQNNILLMSNVNWVNEEGIRYFPDEEIMTAFEIAQMDNAFITELFSDTHLKDYSTLQKALAIKKLYKIDYHLFGQDDKYTMLPFYSIKSDKVEYLPYHIYTNKYGSNGMCAGNSTEEALVQGLSEIIERYVQKQVCFEKSSLPDIPEEYIKKFPYIHEMYKKLNEQENFTFMIKDCSLGGEFPVAALIAIRKDTGKYGIKFGCHPDYGIAMERAFTEALQGTDLKDFTDKSIFDFHNYKVQDDINICNSFKFGIAQYPYEIFLNEANNAFVPVKDVSQLNNKDLLDLMIEKIISMGHDIFIRDVSCLGFPSYHIIVPGMSEIQQITDLKARLINTKVKVARLLNNPVLINKENCDYIMACMEMSSPSHIECSMRAHYGLPIKFDLYGEEIGVGWVYLTAMCFAMKGDYQSAAKRMIDLVNLAENMNCEYYSFYKAVNYYFDGMVVIKNHKKVTDYLAINFNEDICKKVNNIFIEPEKIIAKQYPHHRSNMESRCYNHDCCEHDIFYDCLVELRKKQLKNPIEQKDLSSFFKDTALSRVKVE